MAEFGGNPGGLGDNVGSHTTRPAVIEDKPITKSKRPWAKPCTNASYPTEGFVPRGSVVPAMKTMGKTVVTVGEAVVDVAVCTACVGTGLAVMAVFDGPEIIKNGLLSVGEKVVYAVAELAVNEDYESAGKYLLD